MNTLIEISNPRTSEWTTKNWIAIFGQIGIAGKLLQMDRLRGERGWTVNEASWLH